MNAKKVVIGLVVVLALVLSILAVRQVGSLLHPAQNSVLGEQQTQMQQALDAAEGK